MLNALASTSKNKLTMVFQLIGIYLFPLIQTFVHNTLAPAPTSESGGRRSVPPTGTQQSCATSVALFFHIRQAVCKQNIN